MSYKPTPYVVTDNSTSEEIDLTLAEARLRLNMRSLEQTIKALEEAQKVTLETLNLEFTI